MLKVFILGMGEIGQAHANVLADEYEVVGHDIKFDNPSECDKADVLLVAIPAVPDFVLEVRNWQARISPDLTIVLSTVPPGTCESIGPDVVHATTRGLHPRLEDGIRGIVRHLGGGKAKEAAKLFEAVGIACQTHARSKTTEVAHLLSNYSYRVNLALADEMAMVCRREGVDYLESVIQYATTNNEGFRRIGQPSKMRPILTPPQGKVGGHCVQQNTDILLGLYPELKLGRLEKP